MVGEIRDTETAEISIQAALTGHLVFSTLHTNDAPSAMTRLLDMGIEPFLTASSVIGVIAQRLARLVCRECREPYNPGSDLILELRRYGIEAEDKVFFRGRGCKTCNGTGYKGRMAIYEIMRVTDKLRDLVLARASASEIRKAAVAQGMKEMRHSGMELALAGLTTPEEIMRVVYVDYE